MSGVGDAGCRPSRFAVGLVYQHRVELIFGMLGGLLGVAIFKKNAPPPPPPPSAA